MRGPAQATLAGGLWVAWPCGLLQSAVLLAALADGPVGGAGVMLVFAVASAPGLVAAPWLWRRLAGSARPDLAVRLGGLMLALASGWALTHDLWVRFAAYCGIG